MLADLQLALANTGGLFWGSLVEADTAEDGGQSLAVFTRWGDGYVGHAICRDGALVLVIDDKGIECASATDCLAYLMRPMRRLNPKVLSRGELRPA
jgi:hypothetical protein